MSREQITTTIEANILKKLKLEAFQLGLGMNDIIEKSLGLYFEEKAIEKYNKSLENEIPVPLCKTEFLGKKARKGIFE